MAMVQKCFTPSTTNDSPSARMAVFMSSVRDRLTAGSLPHEPNSLPPPTTSANQRRFWASVPSASMKRITVECMCSVIAVLAQPCASVRITSTYAGTSRPRPPWAVGTAAARIPSACRSRQLSTGLAASQS
jgi:hypothetical protein